MALPHQDFDTITGPEVSCTFGLADRTWHCRSGEDVPFPVIARLVAAQREADGADVQVEPFFRAVLVPDEVEDFVALLHDDDSPLTIGRVGPLVQYVSEQVLARPTRRSGRSATGSPQTKPSSRGASSSRDTAASAE